MTVSLCPALHAANTGGVARAICRGEAISPACVFIISSVCSMAIRTAPDPIILLALSFSDIFSFRVSITFIINPEGLLHRRPKLSLIKLISLSLKSGPRYLQNPILLVDGKEPQTERRPSLRRRSLTVF
jgi:hypothetical protein